MLEKIISGGQTGVDLAALHAAANLGIPRGGWCPKGRANERGRIADSYPLTETTGADPVQRTECNVRDADGTLIIAHEPLTGGTALTRDFAASLAKPCMIADPDNPCAAQAIEAWLTKHHIRTLNVAGPRESGSPGIYKQARDLLLAALSSDAAR